MPPPVRGTQHGNGVGDFVERMREHVDDYGYCYSDIATAIRAARNCFQEDNNAWSTLVWVESTPSAKSVEFLYANRVPDPRPPRFVGVGEEKPAIIVTLD